MATYIVVADAARARVFARNSLGRALEIAEFVYPDSALGHGDRGADAATESIESAIDRARQPEQPSIAMEKRAAFFAKELATYLHDVRAHDEADQLILIVAPELLDALRATLDTRIQAMVTKTVDKDSAELIVTIFGLCR